MRHIYRMYKLTEYVDEKTNESIEDEPSKYPWIEEIVADYSEAKNMKSVEVWNILNSCISNQYLQPINHRTAIRVDTGKGRHLLDELWFIPTGLINEELNQYSSLVKFITGGAFGGVLVIIWHIIRR